MLSVFPSGIALDNSSNLYIADFGNNAIREVTPTGVISTPFGNLGGGENAGSSDGVGNAASFDEPNAVAFDGNDTLYVADTGNNLIRAITLSTGQVSTLAGTNGEFDFPNGVAVDGMGNVYVANQDDHTICKVTQGRHGQRLRRSDGRARLRRWRWPDAGAVQFSLRGCGRWHGQRLRGRPRQIARYARSRRPAWSARCRHAGSRRLSRRCRREGALQRAVRTDGRQREQYLRGG